MSGQVREHDWDGDDGRCAECRSRVAVGPCASCEAMICGDCGVFSSDPSGKRVICLSCARLIADVNARPARRSRPLSLKLIAVVLVIAFLAVALTLLR